MIQIKKTLLTLVALLAVTTGAWAEEKMVTINSSTMSSGAVTATGFGIILGANLYVNSNTATITTSEGVITKLVIKKGNVYVDAFTEANVGVAPGTITYGSDEITVTDINAESVTLSRKGTKNWSTSSIDVYYADASAPSGPEVAWDKAAKTGSFTMPGGNVTLEPDYYPQAELATAPTAVNDVPATTDGAILNAGTVKKAIDNEMITDLQGTVMYYAAQVSGDAAPTAPDYDAEGWTEEVPTAANFAQGKVYVWYYIKGADGNGDEYIFSDSEITALGTEGYVTLAAAPTYAVTFADDLAEPDKWTAEPNTDVTKGQTVTVSYTGTKKVLGVKAEKKAAIPALSITNPVVGQVIGSDGKNYAYGSLPQGVTAVAKICYVSGSNGLALALADEEGYMNWSTAIETCAAHTPAFTGGTWKLASKDEWDNMINAADSYEALRDGFSSVGGTDMQSAIYWSSTEDGSGSAWDYYFGGVGGWSSDTKDFYFRVRACLAF